MARVTDDGSDGNRTADADSPSELRRTMHEADQPVTVAESLGWQPQHWPSTTLWAALTSLISLLAAIGGRRWARWPVYLAATPPFLYCLYWTFTYLDKMLPAV